MISNRLKPAVFVIMALFTASQGWALTLNDIIKKVESNYKNIVAFRGSFNQTTNIKTLQKLQQGQGDIFYKKPNKVKWQYRSPMEQEIISDGSTIWLYFPENRQVYIYDLTDTFRMEAANQGQIPGNFLSSLGDLRKEFDVKWGSPRDRDAQGNYIIELVPKRPIVNLRNMFLVVPKDITSAPSSTFPVLASTVYDTYGNMTNIEFLDSGGVSTIEVLETADETVDAKKRAWTLPDTMFTYSPPANVEIIKPPLTRSK